MESKLIEYFLRVAELGSINRAAADLHLSQPALSRHIALLEHQIGAKLFTRTQGGVVPTDAGNLLLGRARPVLRQLAMLIEQVGKRAAGQLSVGVPPSWRHLFTTRYIAKLVEQYPDVSLRLYEGISHELRESVQAGMLDLAIIPYDHMPCAGYQYIKLLREPLVLVSPKKAGLNRHTPVPLSCLHNLGLALPGRSNTIRTFIEDALARERYTFKLAFEANTTGLCMELAGEGLVSTVTPCCAVSESRRWKNKISWSPIRGASFTWALCKNTARSHSPAVREGARLIFQMMAAIVANGEWPGAKQIGQGN